MRRVRHFLLCPLTLSSVIGMIRGVVTPVCGSNLIGYAQNRAWRIGGPASPDNQMAFCRTFHLCTQRIGPHVSYIEEML